MSLYAERGTTQLCVWVLVLAATATPFYAQTPSRLETETASLATIGEQAAALERVRDLSDPAFRDVLKALKEGALYRFEGRFWILTEQGVLKDLRGQSLLDASGQPLLPDKGLEPVALGQSNTALLQEILDGLNLFDANPETRMAAVAGLGNGEQPGVRPLLERALGLERDAAVQVVLLESVNKLKLRDPDPATRLHAAEYFARNRPEAALGPLRSVLDREPDPKVRATIQETVTSIERYLRIRNLVGYAFNGASLASILLIMSLGLAVTFGLMGIINMAHGEMLMLGSYTAYFVQEIFSTRLPAHQNYYFVVAVPLSVVLVGLVGYALERLLLRFLHGRPLEGLLVTWGIGMVLQQGARLYFGDQTSVNPPDWFRGGFEVLPGLIFPKSRIFIMACAACSLATVYLVLYRSRVGLRIRAVMQNRSMAACMGISTGRVDAWTFALGTGLAGLAGCCLSLIGTVDPEVGRTYIVDSFMVVVLGGVGKLAGTAIASMGIGMTGSLLEPAIGGTAGAIYAKVAVLALIILFLQVRPTGIFAAKGRATEVFTG